MRSMRWLPSVALVLAAVFTVACDRAEGPTSAAGEAARPAVAASNGFSIVQTGTVQSFATATMWVSGGGSGTLSVNGHTLKVNPGSVSQRTKFTMATVAGSSITVALTAEDQAGVPVVVFPTPVTLSLSYASAKVGNASKLKVAWLVSGQIVAVQPTRVDKSRKLVTSDLSHFTQWTIAD